MNTSSQHHLEVFESFGYNVFYKSKARTFHVVLHRLLKIPVFSPRSKVPHFSSHLQCDAKPGSAWEHLAGFPCILLTLLPAAVLSPSLAEA